MVMSLPSVQRTAATSGRGDVATIEIERASAKRDLLSIADLSAGEIEHVLASASRLKQETHAGVQNLALAQKTLVMIFEKPSLRTRVSFETGMTQLGGHAIYLAPTDIGMGKREPVKDVGEVLSRMGDMLMARTASHATVEELACHSHVPVINGLSDREHPCQILADLLTIREQKGRLRGLRIAYFGDSENNITHSLALAAGLLGMHFVTCSPPGYWMNRSIATLARTCASESGGTITEMEDLAAAACDADVVYTDTWISMGDEMQRETRLRAFRPFQVTEQVMHHAKDDAIFMHDMPAYRGNEAASTVIDGPQSVIYQQAENRLHAQKAVMLFLARQSLAPSSTPV
jgi:ornithine carbamoyltransferase